MFGEVSGQMPSTGPSLSPFTVKVSWRTRSVSRVSNHTRKGRGWGTKSRPQEVPGLFMLRSTPGCQGDWGMSPECSGPMTSSWKAKRVPDSNISNSPSRVEGWGKRSPPLENDGGCTFFNKTEKTASTENVELKGIAILFVEDTKGPRYIKEPHVCICAEVQGVSEVCLNTNRMSGQYPVRRDGSQTQGVGNRLKKKTPNKTTTDVNIETDDIL